MSEATIRIKNENGVLEEYRVLFTFRCEELDKDYIAFTKDEADNEGKSVIYIAYYNPDEDMTNLIPVTDEDELKMAYEVLEQVIASEKE